MTTQSAEYIILSPERPYFHDNKKNKTSTLEPWKLSATNISECPQSHTQHPLWIFTSCIFISSRKIMSIWSYPASLVNQSGIHNELSCWQTHVTNLVLNELYCFSQHGSYAKISKLIPRHSYPASLVNQTEILIELPCKQKHLPLIIFLPSMEIMANRAHMRYRPS